MDTIQQRGYVKKQNVEGEKLQIINITLEEEKITKKKEEKIIGNENNKLVIQPIGIMVIEFILKSYFGERKILLIISIRS